MQVETYTRENNDIEANRICYLPNVVRNCTVFISFVITNGFRLMVNGTMGTGLGSFLVDFFWPTHLIINEEID